MEKSYNLSVLFDDGEFDAQKGYSSYGSKEAYFSVLYRFTLDSGTIMGICKPEQPDGGNLDIEGLKLCATRLQGLLASIGAINLVWSIQRLTPLLDKNNFVEFWKQFRQVLLQVDKLRKRIISAERAQGDSPNAPAAPQKQEAREPVAGPKYSATLRSGNFEKLFMLIDNFELESASKTASAIMRHSYTPDIDSALANTYKALGEFDFASAYREAQILLRLVAEAKKAESPEKKNILAIDDVPSVLTTLEAMLRDKYNVYCMTDYDSAVKFLCSNTADVILLDIEMPGIDGFGMAQLFRGLPEYTDTPIIFLTGSVSDDHIKMAVNLGVRDFIKKPVDLTVLRYKIESVLAPK